MLSIAILGERHGAIENAGRENAGNDMQYIVTEHGIHVLSIKRIK